MPSFCDVTKTNTDIFLSDHTPPGGLNVVAQQGNHLMLPLNSFISLLNQLASIEIEISLSRTNWVWYF